MSSKKPIGKNANAASAGSGKHVITVIVASVIMLVVMVGTIVIVLPSGTPMKRPIQSIATPYFSQSWKVFAPDILKVNRTLEIRAQWTDEQNGLVHSDWISISDIEEQTVAGNFAPSRIHKNAFNSSGEFLKRYNALESEQRERVRDTFIQVSEDGGFQQIPDDALIEELGNDDSDVIRYLRMDYMYMRYATLYATAGFGKDIERVQWRISGERPNDFQNRFLDAQQYRNSATTFGWRHSNVAMSESVLDEYRELINRTGTEHLFRKAAENAE